jgi:hypothetical protein
MRNRDDLRARRAASRLNRSAEARRLAAEALERATRACQERCEPAPDPCPETAVKRPSKLVERTWYWCKLVKRTWYFDCDGDAEPCRPSPPCPGQGHGGGTGGTGGHGGTGGGHGGAGGHGGPGGGHGGPGGHGGTGGGNGGGRPTRPEGSHTGRGDTGVGLTPEDIHRPDTPGMFGGPRDQLDLPYLFMRANAGDLGARPIVNAPFWESPDIFVLPGVDPAAAPDIPPTLAGIAQAGEPNTLYAHIWNFGNAAANEVIVEFYWVNPSLGINANSVVLVAQTATAIGAKGSANAHVVVKCPEAWVPTFVNGGHECLLVRVWDNPSDFPGQPAFDASWNRHVGQRNIHVNPPPGGGLSAGLTARRPGLEQPILIKVGPLFGAPATVKVDRVSPHSLPWLQLRTGVRGLFPAMAPPTGVPALSPATGPGAGFPTCGRGGATQLVHGDDQHVVFTTTDDAPGEGEAHVYRISAVQEGKVFGGYTVVLLG